MSECRLTTGPFFQCCCKCVHHKQVYKHCTTHEHQPNKCVCSEPSGWICDCPDGQIYDKWPEHSAGCELFTSIDRRAAKPALQAEGDALMAECRETVRVAGEFIAELKVELDRLKQ